jgi:hypothetical protein
VAGGTGGLRPLVPFFFRSCSTASNTVITHKSVELYPEALIKGARTCYGQHRDESADD